MEDTKRTVLVLTMAGNTLMNTSTACTDASTATSFGKAQSGLKPTGTSTRLRAGRTKEW